MISVFAYMIGVILPVYAADTIMTGSLVETGIVWSWSIQTWFVTGALAETGVVSTQSGLWWSLTSTQQFLQDPEYIETIHWLRDNKIITTSVSNFRPTDYITRQESAKIFSQFYSKILGFTGIAGIHNDCNFQDITQTDYSLTDYVKASCKLGILKWSQGKFMPEEYVSKLQMLVILTRMFENKLLDETQNPRYLDYILQARAYNIVPHIDESILDQQITRYELALTLYRYYIKHNLIKHINRPQSRLKAIVMVPNTISSDTKGNKTSTIMVNINQFDVPIWSKPVIDIFDDSYIIRQTKTVIYPELKYSKSRYADLIEIWSDKVVGTISLVIFNNTIEFGTIRPSWSSTYYTISPYQAGYYTLTEIK